MDNTLLNKKNELKLEKITKTVKKRKKKIEIKHLFYIQIISIFLLIAFSSIFFIINNSKYKSFIIENSNLIYLERNEINNIVNNLIENNQMKKLEEFYNSFTKNSLITNLLINYALEYNIPANLFFALCWKESNFYPYAKNRNSNGSYDYGLFQLNSNTYKDYNEKELLDLRKNIKLGAIHFAEEIKYNNNNYYLALISYNGGRGAIKKMSIIYMTDIIKYEEMLNIKFLNFFKK